MCQTSRTACLPKKSLAVKPAVHLPLAVLVSVVLTPRLTPLLPVSGNDVAALPGRAAVGKVDRVGVDSLHRHGKLVLQLAGHVNALACGRVRLAERGDDRGLVFVGVGAGLVHGDLDLVVVQRILAVGLVALVLR